MISRSAGDVIGGYRLEQLVGRGGMGVVFRATHVALERRVAVKLIAPELAANEAFRRRFQRESRLAASIDHPHVIPVYDAGEEQEQLYVAMRYVEGTDLRELLAGAGSLGPEQAVELIGQVSDGLAAAHERGLVHRDVKPANVLLESRGAGYHAYLTDFGLVKEVGGSSGVQTRTGQWLGTPSYAAPEQILGNDVDARTDVYALGCMLYESIAGEPPFERDTDMAKMFAHLSEAPPTLSAARPGVPPALDAVVRTALAKEPDERFASVGELASAARRAIGTTTPPGEQEPVLPVPAVSAQADRETVARPPPTTATPGTVASKRPPPAQPRPTRSRRRGPILAAALALLAAGGVALALVLGGSDDGGESSTAVIPTGNLTSNPSFERSTSGWDVYRSEIERERAADAPNGEYVARVTLAASPGEYSIDDFPETVSSSRKGRLYTAGAWVKGTRETDGEVVCISLRERLEESPEDFPFSNASLRVSAEEYREVRVTHRAAQNGNTIGVHVFRTGAGVSAGESFRVDAITLTQGSGDGGGGRTAECEA